MWVREAQVHRRGPGVEGGQSIWWGELYNYHLNYYHNDLSFTSINSQLSQLQLWSKLSYDFHLVVSFTIMISIIIIIWMETNQLGFPVAKRPGQPERWRLRTPRHPDIMNWWFWQHWAKYRDEKNMFETFSVYQQRARERAGLRVFRESVRQSPSTEPALDAFCRNSPTDRLTD